MSQSTENALQLLNTKKGQPYASAYAASKFAVRGLTLSAAAEYGEQGIRINTVCRKSASQRDLGQTHTCLQLAVSSALFQNGVIADSTQQRAQTCLTSTHPQPSTPWQRKRC